jgi:alkane 1-monooxygenase
MQAAQQPIEALKRLASPGGQPQPRYKDPKRWVWLMSLVVPMAVGLGPALMIFSGDERALWLPVVFFYIVVPLLDFIIGTDTSNPPESAVAQLEADPYYRWITYLLTPALWAAFIFSAAFVATHNLTPSGWIAMAVTGGIVGGFCINLGHELGHKSPMVERWLAKLTLAPTFYGHFTVEHNRGHHREVATPEDSASSRMGESIYRFLLREMPLALVRAWRLESRRLVGQGRSPWSLHNDIVQCGLISLALWCTLVAWLGPVVLPYLLAVSFWANFQLTTANYIEHYGLLRLKDAKGRYEPCAPHHSWNSNHSFSNWALFHLQRHSDHHAHPARRYQSLRHFDNLPQLPSGYFGMFTLAYVPPLWFRVMNPRLVAAVGQRADRINFAPGQRADLMQRWALKD